jgi:hypothetical protein
MAINNPVIDEAVANNKTKYDSIVDGINNFILSNMDSIIMQYAPETSQDDLSALHSQVEQLLSGSTNDLIGDIVSLTIGAFDAAEELYPDSNLVKYTAKFDLGLGIAVDLATNIADHASVEEAIIVSVATNLIVGLVDYGITAIVAAGVAAALGGGALAGGAAFIVGTGTALMATYALSNWLEKEIADGYHYHVGPNTEQKYLVGIGRAEIAVLNGDLSLVLKNNFIDSTTFQDKNVLSNGEQWSNLDSWVIEQKTSGKTPIRIEFIANDNLFRFEFTGKSSLTDFFNQDQEDSKNIVNYILDKHGNDFNVQFGNQTSQIKNYYISEPSQIQSLANDIINMSGDEKKQALSALINLQSFVEIGVTQVSDINVDDYSEQYIKDRTAFLFNYTQETMGETAALTTYYFDDTLSLEAGNDGGIDPVYYWGNKNRQGFAHADHFYGTEGSQIFEGLGGEDYFEGGKGQDTLKGGQDNDTFFIMEEDDDFDIYNGGSGEDKILGSKKSDVIRVNIFEGDDTVEIIDGGGGTWDLLAGTDQADTIDLSNTQLQKIHEIQLGGGSDTLRVSCSRPSYISHQKIVFA